jgi:hypothetical protein
MKRNSCWNVPSFTLRTVGMMAFMLTLWGKSGEAQIWTFTGLVLMLVVGVAIMTSPTNPLPSWFFHK